MRAAVDEWWDVFTFPEGAVIECPDCPARSPELRDIWEAVCWVDRHLHIDCDAYQEALS